MTVTVSTVLAVVPSIVLWKFFMTPSFSADLSGHLRASVTELASHRVFEKKVKSRESREFHMVV